MNEQEIRQRLEDWVDAWNSRDEDRVRSFYAEDAVLYQAAVGKSLTGREHIIDRYRDFNGMAEDSEMTVRALHADGDTGILEVSISGTHTARFLDYEPTGRRLHVETCLIFKFAGDKIVRHTTYLDTATVLRALDLISISGTRAEAA